MTDMRDPFDILRANVPGDEDSIDPYGPEATRTLSEITGTRTRHAPRDTHGLRGVRQRRLVVVAASVLVVVLASAMAWFIATSTIDDSAVTCYRAADLGSDRVGTVADGVPTPEACIPYWQDGTLQLPGQPVGTIPALVGCVTPDGGLAVVPSDGPTTCQDLGLTDTAHDQPTGELGALANAQTEITRYIQSTTCQPIDEAHLAIREILDRNGLTDWAIHIAAATAGDQCASVNYRTPDKAIDLVPIPE